MFRRSTLRPLSGLFLVLWMASCNTPSSGELVISDLGKHYTFDPSITPAHLRNHIERDEDVIGGNTSIRNESADHLDWKGNPNANGFGYFQRNRDLGQVINIPDGDDVTIDAIVLRTARGNNAVMAGTPGAKMYLQFFEVVDFPEQTLRINENGTTKGQRATHGFDMKYNRADDFIEGVTYRPIRRVTGGVFPTSIPPTTRYAYRRSPGEPFGIQDGHLRYVRFDLTDEDEITLQSGRRYAFMVGFEHPGVDRGLGIAVTTKVHTQEAAQFDVDANGTPRWAVRREGDGTLPPTMLDTTEEPTEDALRQTLVRQSMFRPNHWDTLLPTSDGYPDVDTYMTRQFYIEQRLSPALSR
ncbi:hypothetical protein [Crateriforma conspicua]|uniref:Uncharacterized protein n=1 Tax=Crateriforma conspicua TaxID=2527996 RepID=A0A5C5Y6J3_9PLAN|nr:hypothetical protein [Crateriforma conspicua]QDV65172.1 hypothetical protein Mal65_43420 [Crateriforma conspicua]TWT70569.1 hypothetical protein Pan14r_28760 [Crateriforma conspicua]